ncbi:FtsB family cell division protein [Desulfolithobacter sp.]
MASPSRPWTSYEKRRLRQIVVAVIVLVLLWVLFAPGGGYLQYRRLQKELDTLARENMALEEQNDRLRREIKRLQRDEAYLEELARKKYGLLRKNEEVFDFGSPTPSKGKKD